MESIVRFYFTKGIATSTKVTHKAGQSRYPQFCDASSVSPLPLSESTLLMYVSYLAESGLKHSTIKVYLSALRHMQIASGLPDPFTP